MPSPTLTTSAPRSVLPGGARARRRPVVPALLGVLVLGAAVLGTAGLVLRGEALPGTTVAGVDVGGLGPQQVRQRVVARVVPRLLRPLPLTAAGTAFPVVPSQVGLQVDVARTVDAALAAGREGPLTAVRALVGGGRDVRPVAEVDPDLVRVRVEQVRRAVDRQPSAGGFRVAEGLAVVPLPPQQGRTLDVPGTRQAVQDALLRGERDGLTAGVTTTPAPVPPAAVDAVAAAARQALLAPVVLAAGELRLPVAPAQLAPLLGSRVQGDGLVLQVDRAAARRLLAPLVVPLGREPRDARVVLPRPSPVLRAKGDATFRARPVQARVVPALAGRQVDVDAAAERLAVAVEGGQRTATLPVDVQQPEVETAPLQGVDQLVGSFTTSFPCCQNRVTNIRRIARLVDGTVVPPGGRFSLNRAAGPRTAARGFLADGAIIDGELVDVVGGGVSQFATTLYNAAWFAGLPVLDHKPHSRYIGRYPPGREATLDFRSIDLVLRNDTDTPLVLRTASTATSVTAALYGSTGARVVRSTTGPRQPREGGGFRVVVTRTVQQDGRVVDRDRTGWTYQPPLETS